MTTITQEQYEKVVNYLGDHADNMLKDAGITVEEPLYGPSKPVELFTDNSGDIWEVSTHDPSTAYRVVDSERLDYVLHNYGPFKQHTTGVSDAH